MQILHFHETFVTYVSSLLLVLTAWRIADGASLFYTTMEPTKVNVLHPYALYVLFIQPAPVPGGARDDTAALVRILSSFVHKPNTIDHDHIVVPAGWDSWGRIAILCDTFDAKAWSQIRV